MNRVDLLRTTARAATIRRAALCLEAGDLLGFKAAACDVEVLGHARGFLGGYLSELASRVWSIETHFSSTPHLSRGELEGEAYATTRLESRPRTKRLKPGADLREPSDAVWLVDGGGKVRWDDGSGLPDQYERLRSTLHGARWTERALIPSLDRSVHLAEAETGVELCCVAGSVVRVRPRELWRCKLLFERDPYRRVPRVLWPSGGFVLVALATGELVIVRAEDGSVLSRSLPVPDLLRLFDFDARFGVLFATLPNAMDGAAAQSVFLHLLRVQLSTAAPLPTLCFDDGHLTLQNRIEEHLLLDFAWNKGSVVVLQAAEQGTGIIRLSCVRRLRFKRDGTELDSRGRWENLKKRASDCDGTACLYSEETDCRFAKTITLLDVAIPARIKESGTASVMFLPGTGDVLLGYTSSECPSRRQHVIGARANLAAHQGMGCGPQWIDAEGSTLLEGYGHGFSVWDLRTGDRIAARRITEPLPVVPLGDGAGVVLKDHIAACSRTPSWSDDTARGVWVDSTCEMIVATYRGYSIGVSLADGRAYWFDHPDYQWCATDALGRSIFRWMPQGRLPEGGSGLNLYRANFGEVASIVPLATWPFDGIAGCWSPNTRYFAMDGVIIDVARTALPWGMRSEPRSCYSYYSDEPVRAISNCGRRAIILESHHEGYKLIHAAGRGGYVEVPLEPSDLRDVYSHDGKFHAEWAFSPDGLHVVASFPPRYRVDGSRIVKHEGKLAFWCAATGRLEAQLPMVGRAIGALSFSPLGEVSPCHVEQGEIVALLLRTRAATVTEERARLIRAARKRCFSEIARLQTGSSDPLARAVWGMLRVDEELYARVLAASAYARRSLLYESGEVGAVPSLQRRLRAVLDSAFLALIHPTGKDY